MAMLMQLKPNFPTHVSRSRTTPTFTGIVAEAIVFSATAASTKNKLQKRTKKSQEIQNKSLVGISSIFFPSECMVLRQLEVVFFMVGDGWVVL
ncbi:hypothetical protein SLEP1_g58635 [Rubroshorea leprosula]|uniref:Uncharacterized protein n=1 Tax=Rubroshorea leprosula TaxID=152421 RepID=A0AAV5MU10_9ROSI|nr:hypothetical protein SLEP1_g58635 [Rubroshorea leprosula]